MEQCLPDSCAGGLRRPTKFVAQLLQGLLRVDERPALDQAHHTLGLRPGGREPPDLLSLTGPELKPDPLPCQ